MEKFIFELYYRLTLKSPDFWLKARKICLSIAAICGILTEQGLGLTIIGYDLTKITAILTAGAAIASFFAVDDNKELEKKLDK